MTIGSALRKRANSCVRRLMRAAGFKGEEGAALVEFAVTLPLFLMVLTGTASFSLGLYFLQQIGNATSTAAQLLGAEAGLLTDPCATVKSSITASLPNLTASKLSYTVSITDASGTAHTSSAANCTALASDMAPNEPVTVTVVYTYSWMPVFRFSPSSNLTSSETALAE